MDLDADRVPRLIDDRAVLRRLLVDGDPGGLDVDVLDTLRLDRLTNAVISVFAAFNASPLLPRVTETPRLISALSGVAFCVPSPTTVTVSRGPATLPAPTAAWLAAAPPAAPALTATAVTADAAIAMSAPIAISIPRVARVPLKVRMMSFLQPMSPLMNLR